MNTLAWAVYGALLLVAALIAWYMHATRCKRWGHNWCAYSLTTDKCLRCGKERTAITAVARAALEGLEGKGRP